MGVMKRGYGPAPERELYFPWCPVPGEVGRSEKARLKKISMDNRGRPLTMQRLPQDGGQDQQAGSSTTRVSTGRGNTIPAPEGAKSVHLE